MSRVHATGLRSSALLCPDQEGDRCALQSGHQPTQGPAPGGRRPTLGIFLDWLEDEYQNAVLCGVDDIAREENANLICFAGGSLESPLRMSSQRNVIYRLAGAESIDGLIVLSGALGNAVGPERLAAFCERYRPLPLCSVAWAVDGFPCVLVDNATGMREALLHLIDHHGHRRIGFIRGPSRNSEAARRYAVYQEILTERGIPEDPALVMEGDFQRAAGQKAVATWFDERHVNLDAIVAASDTMALGAMDALRGRGIRIPEDIAVVGFDDLEEARFSVPPLTTVRQPLYEQGVQAAHNVLRQLQGEAVCERVILHTQLVRRHSCGCVGLQTIHLTSPPKLGSIDFATAVSERLPQLSEALFATLNPPSLGIETGVEREVLDTLIHDLRGTSPISFLSWLGQTLENVREEGGDLNPWHKVLSTLRTELLPCTESSPQLRDRLEDLLQEARGILGATLERAQAQARLHSERWARTLSRTGEALITAFDVVSLVKAVAEQFPRLSIGSCQISLYENPLFPEHQARLILEYPEPTPSSRDPRTSLFQSKSLAPPGVLPRHRRTTTVVEPLFFKEDQLGFALFEMGPREGVVYEALRDQISASIKGALLVEQVVERDQERQRLLRDLERRAHQLEEAYDALKQNQEKLLLQEKMASLGRLTASIAHEMNTPLAAARTALVELGRLVDEYSSSVNDPEITQRDHIEIADEMRRAIQLASNSARRASEYVRGIKTQTRDLSPSERQRFNAVPYVREALLLLSYSLRQSNCVAIFEPGPNAYEIEGSPGRLAQVVTNLVTNAIDASVAKGGGPISLEFSSSENRTLLRVTDSGKGIPADIMPRIFDPMFTTKPFGQGTGLGLAIVWDIVTRDFTGTIEAISTAGLGTTFTISFPTPDPQAQKGALDV